MSRGHSALGAHATGFPRVSGDEPMLITTMFYNYSFSPRERG